MGFIGLLRPVPLASRRGLRGRSPPQPPWMAGSPEGGLERLGAHRKVQEKSTGQTGFVFATQENSRKASCGFRRASGRSRPVSLRLGHTTALDARRKRLHPFTTVVPLRYPDTAGRCFFRAGAAPLHPLHRGNPTPRQPQIFLVIQIPFRYFLSMDKKFFETP